MSNAPTLNSRLRVLIAKTFRAEKLYAAIRNTNSEKFTNSAALAEVANDLRAKEWQKAHYQLRVALNEIINLGSGTAVIAELLQLREHFLKAVDESSRIVDQGMEDLLETARRAEFTHVFKASIEMMRQKARLQANKVIVDELSTILDSCSRGAALQAKQAVVEREAAAAPRSNVIPLKRRFAAGGLASQ